MSKAQLLEPHEMKEDLDEKTSVRAIVDCMRDGKFPAVWLGPRRPRCPAQVWKKFLQGEPIPDRYFVGKPAQ
ncbi:MAG: hypothetical protein AB2809_06945 [Candidatus Thiodiazotropha sp.]